MVISVEHIHTHYNKSKETYKQQQKSMSYFEVNKKALKNTKKL